MPATETKHTPEHWAQNFAAYISSLDTEGYIAELADLKRRADQADRMYASLDNLMCVLDAGDMPGQQLMSNARAALADNPPAR